MRFFVVSDENVYLLKSALSAAQLGFRHSHLLEAFAYGFGYRTFAALNAAARLFPCKVFHIKEFADEKCNVRLVELSGRRLPEGFAIKLVENLKLVDLVFIRTGNVQGWLRDLWFNECKMNNIPFIYTISKRKYVNLTWDCFSMDPKCDIKIRKDRGELLDVMFEVFRKYAGSQSRRAVFEGGAFYGNIENLLPENAEKIAEAYFLLLNDAKTKEDKNEGLFMS